MKKAAKALTKDLERLGYVWTGSNSKGLMAYTHPGGHQILISGGIHETAARDLLRTAREACGVAEVPTSKRHSDAIKERRARERDVHQRELKQHEDLLDQLLAERDRMLAGHAADLTSRQIRDIEACIERTEREVAKYARLMTEVPSSASHSGTARTARHRAGAA
jgi:hypothetical protein